MSPVCVRLNLRPLNTPSSLPSRCSGGRSSAPPAAPYPKRSAGCPSSFSPASPRCPRFCCFYGSNGAVPDKSIAPIRSLLSCIEEPSSQNIPSGSAANRCYHLATVRMGWAILAEKTGFSERMGRLIAEMATKSQITPEDAGASRFLPLLLLLFMASGFSALVYEIVWYQLLQLTIGSTAVSLGVLLATFMGGLCIGSTAVPRFRAALARPLRVYAFLELGMGLCSILVLFAIPYIDRVYFAAVGYGLPGALLRALLCSVCLLPPTALMGASLPVLARWIESSPRGISWWGLLYSGNTVGAVFGCLCAGFYLLRIYNVSTATYVAAVVNFLVAATSFVLASRLPSQVRVPEKVELFLIGMSSEAPADRASRWFVYLAIGISGATALGAEVIWTRLMGMMLGSTVYVFSIILAVFLAGLAAGGAAGALLLRLTKPRLALGWCQMLLCLGIAWSAYNISDSLPYWPINTLLSSAPWYTFQLDLVRCLWTILPATLLWGASFPLALAAVASPDKDSGRLVGGIYAANTFGGIIGALAVSLALIPWIGTQQSQRLLLVLSAVSALFVLGPYIRESWSRQVAAWLAVSAVCVALLA